MPLRGHRRAMLSPNARQKKNKASGRVNQAERHMHSAVLRVVQAIYSTSDAWAFPFRVDNYINFWEILKLLEENGFRYKVINLDSYADAEEYIKRMIEEGAGIPLLFVIDSDIEKSNKLVVVEPTDNLVEALKKLYYNVLSDYRIKKGSAFNKNYFLEAIKDIVSGSPKAKLLEKGINPYYIEQNDMQTTAFTFKIGGFSGIAIPTDVNTFFFSAVKENIEGIEKLWEPENKEDKETIEKFKSQLKEILSEIPLGEAEEIGTINARGLLEFVYDNIKKMDAGYLSPLTDEVFLINDNGALRAFLVSTPKKFETFVYPIAGVKIGRASGQAIKNMLFSDIMAKGSAHLLITIVPESLSKSAKLKLLKKGKYGLIIIDSEDIVFGYATKDNLSAILNIDSLIMNKLIEIKRRISRLSVGREEKINRYTIFGRFNSIAFVKNGNKYILGAEETLESTQGLRIVIFGGAQIKSIAKKLGIHIIASEESSEINVQFSPSQEKVFDSDEPDIIDKIVIFDDGLLIERNDGVGYIASRITGGLAHDIKKVASSRNLERDARIMIDSLEDIWSISLSSDGKCLLFRLKNGREEPICTLGKFDFSDAVITRALYLARLLQAERIFFGKNYIAVEGKRGVKGVVMKV